jgi:hypothetical protein
MKMKASVFDKKFDDGESVIEYLDLSKITSRKSKAIPKTITVYRSSDTGKFVSSTFAKKHPKTTFKQTVRPPITKKKK